MLMAITWPQTVSSLERQHPPWIFRGKSADLIQLPKVVLGEREFNRCEIVLKLVEPFRTNNDRGHHRRVGTKKLPARSERGRWGQGRLAGCFEEVIGAAHAPLSHQVVQTLALLNCRTSGQR